MHATMPLLLVPFALTGVCRSPGPGAAHVLAADGTSARPQSKTTAPARAAAGSSPRWLVAVAHDPSSVTAHFLPVELPEGWPSSGRPAVGDPLALPALPHANWQGHTQVLAALGGEHLVVACPGAASGDSGVSSWQLEHRALGRAPRPATVELGAARPAALLVRAAKVYVGTAGAIGVVDLALPRPSLVTVHQRPGVEKPYDLFVCERDLLLALDDEVAPVYADTFRIDERGRLEHLAAWSMPGVINGSYTLAALAMRAAERGTLFAVAPYSIMDGSGHDLVALPLRHGKAEFPADLVLQNAGSGSPPVLEEHEPRAGVPGEGRKLAAGAELTPWTALALLPSAGGEQRLAVAAGKRGLLLLPLDFRADSLATMVDVGGPCLDLVLHREGVVALVGDRAARPGGSGPLTRLSAWRWNGRTLVQTGEVSLRGSWQALVH